MRHLVSSFLLIAASAFTSSACTSQVHYADLRSPRQCTLVKHQPDAYLQTWIDVAWDCGPDLRIVGTARRGGSSCGEGDWSVMLNNERIDRGAHLGEGRPLSDMPGDIVFNRFCQSDSELAALLHVPVANIASRQPRY